MVRTAASRTVAKASGNRSSSFPPSAYRTLYSSVRARNSASVSDLKWSSIALTSAAIAVSWRRIFFSPTRSSRSRTPTFAYLPRTKACMRPALSCYVQPPARCAVPSRAPGLEVDQTHPRPDHDRLGASGRVQLVQDRPHVVLHCVVADEQAHGDVPVAQAG